MTKPKTTEAQRARFRELTYPAKDDYGKTALQILDDLKAAEAQVAAAKERMSEHMRMHR